MEEKEPAHYWVESTDVGHNQDTFIFKMYSGGVRFAFVISPDHAKQFMRILTKGIATYEKDYGNLEARLPDEPMPSPFINKDKQSPGI